jgi:hypothetical protein
VDPLSLVLGALGAGAAAGMRESASEAVRDAYGALKGLVRRRVGGDDPAGDVVLDQHDADPETWSAPLAKVLTSSGAVEDADVVAAAQHLMSLLDADGAAAGKYHVDLRGAQGVQVGDGNQQANVFGRPPAS